MICPECHSENYKKHGKRMRRIQTEHGKVKVEVQVFRCKTCGHIFVSDEEVASKTKEE